MGGIFRSARGCGGARVDACRTVLRLTEQSAAGTGTQPTAGGNAYAGPSSPDFPGNIVIVGHNYRDDSHFGRLDELEIGSIVRLMDKYGDFTDYEVYDMETVASDQAEALEKYEGEYGLTPITCTAGGESRLLVRAVNPETARDKRAKATTA